MSRLSRGELSAPTARRTERNADERILKDIPLLVDERFRRDLDRDR